MYKWFMHIHVNHSETTNSLVNVSREDDRVQRQYDAPRPIRHEMMYILFQKAEQIFIGLEVIQHQLPRKKIYSHCTSLTSLYNKCFYKNVQHSIHSLDLYINNFHKI